MTICQVCSNWCPDDICPTCTSKEVNPKTLIHPDLVKTARKYFPGAFETKRWETDEQILNNDLPLDATATLLLMDSIENLTTIIMAELTKEKKDK